MFQLCRMRGANLPSFLLPCCQCCRGTSAEGLNRGEWCRTMGIWYDKGCKKQRNSKQHLATPNIWIQFYICMLYRRLRSLILYDASQQTGLGMGCISFHIISSFIHKGLISTTISTGKRRSLPTVPISSHQFPSRFARPGPIWHRKIAGVENPPCFAWWFGILSSGLR